jgi:hypothetical protein
MWTSPYLEIEEDGLEDVYFGGEGDSNENTIEVGEGWKIEVDGDDSNDKDGK